ncbi:ABC transporter permease [Winogradskyella sp.]|uniref:ABC transporter permease n=1 Tax=Winogradskyella sp. TaxID=1883156 RepID=UPI003BAB28DE
MLRNYFKIAFRNLLKNKVYSAINIGGLAIGMACFLLIALFIQNELSYDRYHEKADNIYRVIHNRNTDNSDPWVWGNAPIGPALKSDFPEIIEKVQFSGRSDILLTYEENSFQESECFYVDATVFDVFSWSLIYGDAETALETPYSIVLTETTAKKYFGNQNPVGKTIEGIGGRANDGTYTVTGVMADVPSNSHFNFDVLMSMSSFYQSRPEIFEWWGYVDFYTYLLVSNNFDPKGFQSKTSNFLDKYLGPRDAENYYDFHLEALQDSYLHSEAVRQPGTTGSLSNLYIFGCIGLFLLAIACINFMNLSTARSLERAKEVGVRKVVGASRKGLMYQFLGESFILVLLASVLGLVLAFLSLSWMTNFTGKEFYIEDILNVPTLALYMGMVLLTGFLSGSYPALVLSGFKPIGVLKGTFKSSPSGARVRKGLVVFQFSLSIALIASTVLVYNQLQFMMDKDLGFDQEHQLILDFNWDDEVLNNLEAFKHEFKRHPDIASVSVTRTVPSTHFPAAGTTVETPNGEMKHFSPFVFEVDEAFVPHYNIKVIAGRTYSKDFASDTISSLVINAAAAKSFGYANPSDIVGKKFQQWGREGNIIGVVDDFNYISLHNEVAPLTLRYLPVGRYFSLKMQSNNLQRTITEIREIWNQMAPHRPFMYKFLDTAFNEQYQADIKFRKLFILFSFLAIGIACLGLLGLATYSAMQRTKEIGIRKVLGAKATHIVTLLSKDFIKLVVIAIFIATPFSWYAMNQWLNSYAYKIDIQWWIFALSGSIAIIIAIATIGFHAFKSAMSNPVKSLRTE